MNIPASPVTLERGKIKELMAREMKRLNDSTPKSAATYERARQTMPLGIASSYHWRDPWPIYLTDGKGSKIWDVDGHEYIDYLNGFGCMVHGHAHPAIVSAVQDRITRGSQFCEPTEESIVVAEELKRRWGLPKWRFTNSGTEATMDAIRIARGFTGRDTIVKIFGSFHGHHDYVMVSTYLPVEKIGPRDNYNSIPYGKGIPACVPPLTVPVPFNDAAATETRIERLIDEGRKPACIILEPAMMNIGVVLPEPGYLEALRELTRKHGILLIFDEVKTGLTVAPGGATEYFGVKPDIVTIAKCLTGGLPGGAIGGIEEVWEPVERQEVWQVGTYNGNPLCMAAAKATLFEVLNEQGYQHLDALREYLLQGCQKVIDRYNLPAYPVGLGCKGFVTFSPVKIVDYESYLANQDGELTELAWHYLANRGVMAAPGRDQEFTISVQHSIEDADRYIAAFDEMAAELTA
jgi:glutamate-1-semialdehyde 2,1-aminomutase